MVIRSLQQGGACSFSDASDAGDCDLCPGFCCLTHGVHSNAHGSGNSGNGAKSKNLDEMGIGAQP